MATFLQLRGRVKDNTQRPSGLDDAEAGAIVNDAYYEVCSRLRTPVASVTRTMTANVSDYLITAAPVSLSDLTNIVSIIVSSSNGTLLEETPDTILFYRNQGSVVGSPQCYALQGLDTLMFWPAFALNDTITLLYAQRPAAMVADGDTPSALPLEWQDLVELCASMRAMRVTSTPEARQLRADYEARLRDARGWMNTRGSSRSMRIDRAHAARGSGYVTYPSDYSSGS